MFARFACLALGGAALSATALGAGTVTLSLTSPVAGQTIAPGTTVNWTINVTVSTGDNLGLALIVCNLLQDPNNPAPFDIPPGSAASIPAAMTGFNRPGGIANPGENGAPSGYIGVQRGDPGTKNLFQIGGAQNTFGQAGTLIGTDPVVDPGIGQSGPQAILSGSFSAPTTFGTYTFRLAGGVANVLTSVGAPPQMSEVSQATVDTSAALFSFTVGQSVCRGDLNCDGQINFGDINPFVMYLSNFANWQGSYQGCNPENGDINGDGTYGQASFGDINPFVALMSQCGVGCSCPGPLSRP